MLEAYPNLEKSRINHQGIMKMFTLHLKSYDEKMTKTIQTPLDRFHIKEQNSLIFNVSNALNFYVLKISFIIFFHFSTISF